MQDFPANSQKAKTRSETPPPGERAEKIQRVTSTEAERRPRGLGRKFKDTFIGGSARMAFDYMVVDVVIPAIQDMMIDAFQGGVEKLFRGDTRPRRGPSSYSSYSNLGHVNYQSMSTVPRSTGPAPSRTLSRRSRARQDFDELVIHDQREANDIIDRMYDILSRYGMVTVAELYEMAGVQSSHTDNKWGWTRLQGARAQRLRNGGYLLNLPDPEPLS